jgi:hypothetical protein
MARSNLKNCRLRAGIVLKSKRLPGAIRIKLTRYDLSAAMIVERARA